MKPLLNTTLLFFLVIGFSGGVSGQDGPDFEETKRLAERGSVIDQYNLGRMYNRGEEGVPRNEAEAVRWYMLAAEQGHGIAQKNLGEMYDRGEGVPQNNLRAYVWMSVSAAEQGYGLVHDVLTSYRQRMRDRMAERLTPELLARGQDMATRCFESDFQDCE